MNKKILCLFLTVLLFTNTVISASADETYNRAGFDSKKLNCSASCYIYGKTKLKAHIGWLAWDQYVISEGTSTVNIYNIPSGYIEKVDNDGHTIVFKAIGISMGKVNFGNAPGVDLDTDKTTYTYGSTATMMSYSITSEIANLVGYRETHSYSSRILTVTGAEYEAFLLSTTYSMY